MLGRLVFIWSDPCHMLSLPYMLSSISHWKAQRGNRVAVKDFTCQEHKLQLIKTCTDNDSVTQVENPRKTNQHCFQE